MSYRSYCFTIRCKGGLPEAVRIPMIKYLTKQKYKCYVIEGKDESEHLHAQVWYDEPKIKGDLTKQLRRIQERGDPDWCQASNKVLVMGVKIAYSDSFHEEYMLKENTDGIFEPPLDTKGYYPSEEEQNAVKAKFNAVDPKFHRLLTTFNERPPKAWAESPPALRLGLVAEWLYDEMFNLKTEKVITDSKKVRETVKSLYHYIVGGQNGVKWGLSEKDYNTHKKITDRLSEE